MSSINCERLAEGWFNVPESWSFTVTGGQTIKYCHYARSHTLAAIRERNQKERRSNINIWISVTGVDQRYNELSGRNPHVISLLSAIALFLESTGAYARFLAQVKVYLVHTSHIET